MKKALKVIFFGILVKPIVFIILGINFKKINQLPMSGPAIIVANHNSHLDTIVLMSLYPLSKIHMIRPVAAADYFLNKGKFLTWLSLNFIDIIPIYRKGNVSHKVLFENCHKALDNKDILIFFPEGTRGKPEQVSPLRKGIFFLAKSRANIKIIPMFIHGLGRSLPKGNILLVPFNCDVVVGNEIEITGNSTHFIASIFKEFKFLSQYCLTKSSLR